MYQEYLAEFWSSAKALENSKVSFSIPKGGIYGEVGLNIFRNAIGVHYQPHSSEYVTPPSIDVVRKWFPMIRYEEDVLTKGTLRKSLLPPRWRLLMAQIIQCLEGKTGGFDQITNKDVIMLYSLANGIHIDYAKIFWEDIILKLKKKQREKIVPYTRFLSLLIMHKMKEDCDHMLAICDLDKPVVFKAQKTSSRAKSVFQGAKPGAKTRHKKPTTSSKQPFVSSKKETKVGPLRHPLVPKLAIPKGEKNFTADPGLSAPNDSIPSQQGMDEGTKNTSYDHISAGTDPYVLVDQIKSISEGLETVITQPTTKKGASSTAIHGDKEEASSTIKLEDLTKLVSQIQPSFKDLDSPEDGLFIIIDESDKDEPNVKLKTLYSLPTELKDLPSKFNELTKEIKGLKTQVHELEIKLPKELKEIPAKIEDFTMTATSLRSQVAEPKTLQWEILEEFLSLPARVESAQAKLKTLDALPSLLLNVIKALNKFAKIEEEAKAKAAKKEGEVRKVELIDLLGLESRIKNHQRDVLTRKGLITFKVYIEDVTYEVILNFKVSDLHLGEWREVMKACLARKGKGWKTIYDQIQTRMDYLHTTEAERGINLDISLRFVTIKDLKDFSNSMLYTIQEIFFRQHQGPGVDDHARTFSSLLLAEVDKRNPNPLKQIRTIEHLRNYDIETEEGSWLELQFSLLDNSKLNVVYLLNRSQNISFTSRRFTRREKECFMPKGIKQSPLEMVLLNTAEKYIYFSLKDCTTFTVGIKRHLNAVGITAAYIDVNIALMKLVMLLNFKKNILKDMDQDSTYMVAASKVLMLKPGKFEIWRMIIKQYIQIIDYALWEVIENDATLPRTQVVDGVTTMLPITTAGEKAQRRLEKLLEFVEKRFSGNAATKKTQRNLLKQQFEKFSVPSSEMLDQTFDKLKKLVSQLELLGEKISQKDVNQKLLRSLSPEWNTHVVVWRKKADLDTMSMDNLYYNLKVYELEVKGMSSSNSNTQNMAFLSSTNSSTNVTVNTANGVSTAPSQVNVAFSTNINNLSNAI
nr:hypothetical protein [Tanacetum cinerariifolium]